MHQATVFKNQGDEAFKAGPKYYREALERYDRCMYAICQHCHVVAMEVNPPSEKLRVHILSNRALCHLKLENYRKCLEDCMAAYSLDKTVGGGGDDLCMTHRRSRLSCVSLQCIKS